MSSFVRRLVQHLTYADLVRVIASIAHPTEESIGNPPGVLCCAEKSGLPFFLKYVVPNNHSIETSNMQVSRNILANVIVQELRICIYVQSQ